LVRDLFPLPTLNGTLEIVANAKEREHGLQWKLSTDDYIFISSLSHHTNVITLIKSILAKNKRREKKKTESKDFNSAMSCQEGGIVE
jgi:hypothetical protein